MSQQQQLLVPVALHDLLAMIPELFAESVSRLVYLKLLTLPSYSLNFSLNVFYDFQSKTKVFMSTYDCHLQNGGFGGTLLNIKLGVTPQNP